MQKDGHKFTAGETNKINAYFFKWLNPLVKNEFPGAKDAAVRFLKSNNLLKFNLFCHLFCGRIIMNVKKHYSNMLDNGATLETIQIMNTQLSEIDVKSNIFTKSNKN